MLRNFLVLDRRKNLGNPRRTNINEHVRIGEPLDSTLERRFRARMNSPVDQSFSAVILFEDFSIGDGDYSIVVEAEPSSIGSWLDENEVVTAVDVSRVNENSVKLVEMRFALVRFRVEVRRKVDLVREFVSIVDLIIAPSVRKDERLRETTDFDILISNDIVLETLELKVEHWRERFEDDSFPRVLQSIPFGRVSILSFQRFDLNVILERVL